MSAPEGEDTTPEVEQQPTEPIPDSENRQELPTQRPLTVGDLKEALAQINVPDSTELRTTRLENGRPAYVRQVFLGNGFFMMATEETGEF